VAGLVSAFILIAFGVELTPGVVGGAVGGSVGAVVSSAAHKSKSSKR